MAIFTPPAIEVVPVTESFHSQRISLQTGKKTIFL